MKLLSSRPSALAALILLPLAAAADEKKFECGSIEADGFTFDLSKLKGPHSVVTTENTPPTVRNTTYTLDLCGPLRRKGDVKEADRCPDGTWVCAIQHVGRKDDDDKTPHRPEEVIPIAGDLADAGGSALKPAATRLKTSTRTGDADKVGLRLVLGGGAYPLAAKPDERTEQSAVVELQCDPDVEGTEGEVRPEEEYESAGTRATATRSAEASPATAVTGAATSQLRMPQGGEKQVEGEKKPALVFAGYVDGKDGGKELHLTWRTKYACEKGVDEGDEAKASAGWGFFTWFVVIVFMGTAAYLIFGSWLNYNRYGARGWDLLPHGDTIRDIPYLLQDWTRGVVRLLQGGGSRGGYSAV